jgi:hypothetical protein
VSNDTQEQKKSSLYGDKALKKAYKAAEELLERMGGQRVTAETSFEYRTDKSVKIALPSNPEEMDVEQAAMLLTEQAVANKKMYEFSQPFKARPMDGAYAFDRVLKEVYGTTAIGQAQVSMFGTKLPDFKTVRISPSETAQVPFGLLTFTPLEATFMLHAVEHDDYGHAFQIRVAAPKKNKTKIDGLFALVEAYLLKHSIYQNKALIGVGKVVDGEYREPDFFNPYEIDRDKVIYKQDVERLLNTHVFGRIYRWELLRQAEPKIQICNKVLLEGENGTGKTLALAVAAQHCLEHGWTFVQARWDEDLKKVVSFAERVGVPTLVAIEDIEKLIQRDPKEMDALLDLFDGISAKSREVSLLMTSNHADELTRSMTRAGRIDRMIYVSELDREGVEKLIKVLIPEEQREDLDYEALHIAYDRYTPAWIVESLKSVRVASMIRTGTLNAKLATQDFVTEADSLRPAWERHQGAVDRPPVDQLGHIFEDIISTVVDERMANHRVDVEDTGKILVTD